MTGLPRCQGCLSLPGSTLVAGGLPVVARERAGPRPMMTRSPRCLSACLKRSVDEEQSRIGEGAPRVVEGLAPFTAVAEWAAPASAATLSAP